MRGHKAPVTGSEGLVEVQMQLQLGPAVGQEESASVCKLWALHEREGQSGLPHHEATGPASGRWVGL